MSRSITVRTVTEMEAEAEKDDEQLEEAGCGS